MAAGLFVLLALPLSIRGARGAAHEQKLLIQVGHRTTGYAGFSLL
jgi:hypothetical protein